MTQESTAVLGIAAQISALPDYHDIARRMLARLANRSAETLVGKSKKPKGGRPALGKIRLDQLNSDMLERFKSALASAPKLSRNGKAAGLAVSGATNTSGGEEPDSRPSNEPEDREQHEERMRKRRARTNRIITPLRAALNHAVKKKMIATDTAWRTALKPYPDVDGISERYLTLKECKALQDHADDDFRPLERISLILEHIHREQNNLRTLLR